MSGTDGSRRKRRRSIFFDGIPEEIVKHVAWSRWDNEAYEHQDWENQGGNGEGGGDAQDDGEEYNQAWDDDETLLEQAEALRKTIAARIGDGTEDAL